MLAGHFPLIVTVGGKGRERQTRVAICFALYSFISIKQVRNAPDPLGLKFDLFIYFLQDSLQIENFTSSALHITTE